MLLLIIILFILFSNSSKSSGKSLSNYPNEILKIDFKRIKSNL
nr:MAG TPA: envelope protein [Caudoviricetes sp.]